MLVLALHNSSLEINCDLFIFLVLQLKIYKFHGEFFMQTLKKELPRLHVPIVSKKNMQRAAKQLQLVSILSLKNHEPEMIDCDSFHYRICGVKGKIFMVSTLFFVIFFRINELIWLIIIKYMGQLQENCTAGCFQNRFFKVLLQRKMSVILMVYTFGCIKNQGAP